MYHNAFGCMFASLESFWQQHCMKHAGNSTLYLAMLVLQEVCAENMRLHMT